jgi:biotin carboxylase
LTFFESRGLLNMSATLPRNKKRILIIGSGPWQLHLLRKARDLGYAIVNTNLYKDSVGFALSDVGIAVDIFDRERHVEIAREYGVQGVTSDQIDIAVPTVAYVCERLGLPGIGSRCADLFTHKVRMRQFCGTLGVTQPRYRACVSPEEALAAVPTLGGYPVILKPTNNRSSRGVHKVEEDAALVTALADTMANSREPTFLVEEYIGGLELSVEGIKTPQRHFTLAVSRKKQFAHNTVLDWQVWYPRDDRSIDVEALARTHDALIEATHLPFGLTHAEYKLHDGRFYPIEFAARGGGANISSHVVPLKSGIDATGLLVRMAMGEPAEEVWPLDTGRAVMLEFFELAPGTVKAIRGLDDIRALPGVVDVAVTFHPGDTIVPPQHGGVRAGHFIAMADSDRALEKLCAQVRKTLCVDYT